MEESVSQMTTILSNILEHHGRVKSTSSFFGGGSCSCKERGGEAEGHDRGSREREKRDECQSGIDGEKELYELLKAKMEGFQIANHQE
ncbi:hypothetical protein R1flu_021704 [Riccia fluitans]|uniref:Uncharacterized protein n=1 Tax=Riccia fluitans TaxID=41844 RepID=A0ABD1ZRY0_9MARC